MEGVWFIDKEGNVLHCDTIESHTALANLIIQENPQIKVEFEKSKERDPVDFLILKKGYIKARNNSYYRRGLTYDSQMLSEIQRKAIPSFYEEGYRLDDVALIRIRKKRQEQLK